MLVTRFGKIKKAVDRIDQLKRSLKIKETILTDVRKILEVPEDASISNHARSLMRRNKEAQVLQTDLEKIRRIFQIPLGQGTLDFCQDLANAIFELNKRII